MKTLLGRLAGAAFRRLPGRWRYAMRRNRYSTFEMSAQFRRVRQHLYRIPLTEQAFIDIFWKALPTGWGPAASVVVQDQEVLRFDCFGPGDGHLHASLFENAPASEFRLWFSENTVNEQIERSVFELTHNLYYYTQRSPYAEVRTFRVDNVLIQRAGEQMRAKMNEYILVNTR